MCLLKKIKYNIYCINRILNKSSEKNFDLITVGQVLEYRNHVLTCGKDNNMFDISV